MRPIFYQSVSAFRTALREQPDRFRGVCYLAIGSGVYVVNGIVEKVLPATKAAVANLRAWFGRQESLIPGTRAVAAEIQALVFRPLHSGQPVVSPPVRPSILRTPGTKAPSGNRVHFADESVQQRTEGGQQNLWLQKVFQKNFQALQSRTPASDVVVRFPMRFSGSNLSPAETHILVINPLSGRLESGRVHANRVAIPVPSMRCIVVQTPEDQSFVEGFWRMVMQQRPTMIVDLLHFSRQSDAWRSQLYSLPMTGSLTVGHIRIDAVDTSDGGRTLYIVTDTISGETHQITVERLQLPVDRSREKGVAARVDAATLIMAATSPMIYCNNNAGDASILLATTMLIDRAVCGLLSRSRQLQTLDEVILVLRRDLGPQAIETAADYTVLNHIYAYLLDDQSYRHAQQRR